MIAITRLVGTWRGVIAALVACVIGMAPLSAQARMAQHTVHNAAVEHRSLDRGQSQNSPAVAVSSHDHSAHHHNMAGGSATPKSGQQHDHRDHQDGSCCGTYCHSGCIATMVEAGEPVLLAGIYSTFIAVNRAAVVPDQPQRPPSSRLSI